MRITKKSVRNMSFGLFALLLPLALVLGAASVIQIRVAYDHEWRDTEGRFDALLEQMDQELEKPEIYLTNLFLQSAAMRELNVGGNETQRYFSKVELYDNFGSYLTQNDNLLLLALYCQTSGIYLERDSGLNGIAAAQRLELRTALADQFPDFCRSGTSPSGQWVLCELGERILLLRTMSLEGVYGLCAVDSERFISWAQELSGGEFTLFIRWKEMCVGCSDGSDLPKRLSTVSQGGSRLLEEDDLLAISRPFHGAELIAVARHDLTLPTGSILTVLLACAAALLAATVLVFFLLWRRRVLHPLSVLKRTMEEIRAGNLQSRAVDASAGAEFQEIDATFNNMMEHIRKLKIEGYEKELQNRQIQLQYYQLQIRPHFYLNCLKNLYALTEQKEMDKLGQSILLLSNYLRHTFQQHSNEVTLEEEVYQCRNYVELIGVSAAYSLHFTSEIADEVRLAQVPAVSLLTFVENAVKHAPAGEQAIIILLRADLLRLEEQTYLHITVQDNGPGFPQTSIEQLNAMDWDADTGEHVGLKNVVRRFQLMYEKEIHILFSNNHGAVIELFVPWEYGGDFEDQEGGTDQ